MEIFREITSDVCAAGLPVAIGAIIGSPLGTIPAAVLSSVVKQGAQSCLNRIHDDVLKRQLSSMQATRVEQVLYYAQCAYYEMIEKQGWELMHPESSEYVDAHLDACEHMVINAINESQSNKIPYEGFLFATKYNSTSLSIDDFHMMANILFKMTWRELVLVYIINAGWSVEQQDLFITNPAACVEFFDLITWGLVKPEEGWLIENNSEPIKLSEISITSFGSLFSTSLMLERITEEEKSKIIDSLKLEKLDRQERVNREHGLQWEEFD